MKLEQTYSCLALGLALAFAVACTRPSPQTPDDLAQFNQCQVLVLTRGCPPEKCGGTQLQMSGDPAVEIASGEIVIHAQAQTLSGSDVVNSQLPFAGQDGNPPGVITIEDHKNIDPAVHEYHLTGVPGFSPLIENWFRVGCASTSGITE